MQYVVAIEVLHGGAGHDRKYVGNEDKVLLIHSRRVLGRVECFPRNLFNIDNRVCTVSRTDCLHLAFDVAGECNARRAEQGY